MLRTRAAGDVGVIVGHDGCDLILRDLSRKEVFLLPCVTVAAAKTAFSADNGKVVKLTSPHDYEVIANAAKQEKNVLKVTVNGSFATGKSTLIEAMVELFQSMGIENKVVSRESRTPLPFELEQQERLSRKRNLRENTRIEIHETVQVCEGVTTKV